MTICCLPFLSSGTNFNLTARLLIIEAMLLTGKSPRRLVVQSDGGDGNWSSIVMLFFASLVGWGVFDEVVIGRYLPGHGHEMVDALIALMSRFRFGYRTPGSMGNSSLHLQQWLDQLQFCVYRGRMIGSPRILGAVYNWESYLRSSAHKDFGDGFGFLRCDSPDKQMEPIQVRIRMLGGVVVFQYKSYHDVANDRDWYPSIPQPVFGDDGPPDPFTSQPELGGFNSNYAKTKCKAQMKSIATHVLRGPFKGHFDASVSLNKELNK